MNWITENYINVFAIIGGLYSVARMFVALTPTEKDDLVIEKAGVWLNGIAKIFGLDITQGNNKSK